MFGIKTFIFVIVVLLQDKWLITNVPALLQRLFGLVLNVLAHQEHTDQIVFHAQLQDSGTEIIVLAQRIEFGMAKTVFVLQDFWTKLSSMPITKILDNASSNCVCPQNRVWNGQDCVCAPGLYGPQCLPCPSPRSWDNNSQACVCPKYRVWNGQDCICAPGGWWKDKLVVMPTTKKMVK